MFIKRLQNICIAMMIATIFVKSKRVMIPKEELRKLSKEQQVDLVYAFDQGRYPDITGSDTSDRFFAKQTYYIGTKP